VLPGGQQHGQGLLPLLAAQVQLGGPATAGPTQRMVSGFLLDPARRFLLQLGLRTRTGGVLMRSADRGVDADVPRDQTSSVGARL